MTTAKEKFILKQKSCCNPFGAHEKPKSSGLRAVSQKAIAAHPSLKLQSAQKICTQCRKKLAKRQPGVVETQSEIPLPVTSSAISSSEDNDGGGESPIPGSSGEFEFHSPEMEQNTLNESLGLIGESPIPKKRLAADKYVKSKTKKIGDTVKKKLEIATGLPSNKLQDAGQEMIEQLKHKFESTTKKSEQVQVLTVLPKSWTIAEITEEFDVSSYMARKAKALVSEQGILTMPNPKTGKAISKEIEEKVREFYLSETISRQMPGMKDFVSVLVNGKKQHMQKHLVLCNLKEVYELFKEAHPNVKIGFSKFAELRPRQYVLAGSSGTHSVCVCTTHQNVKLMFTGAKLDSVTGGEFKDYSHCLAAIQCNPPRIECFFGKCSECPGMAGLQDKLETYMQDNMIDQVQYKQWTSTDRSNLETKVQTVADFLDSFQSSLQKLLPHSFIAKQQSRYLQNLKNTLEPGVFLVIADFAENYSFVVQDASQSFHWNNLQATIHPFVCYYRQSMQDKTPEHINFAIISECNIHDTVAVHLFQKLFLQFLTTKFGQRPKKVCYFSDGCAAQYKNRNNFSNLCLHEEDFGVPAEWHFFATSHGKGPSDGVGGTIKRLAGKASLQRPYDQQIITPRQLFEFADSEIANVNCQFATAEQYEQESKLLKARFEETRTIPGTLKLHCFVPVSKEKVTVRAFSFSAEERKEHVKLTPGMIDHNVSAITGYVTVDYDGHWWVACVMEHTPERHEVDVKFLHPHGPSPAYTFPEPSDPLTIDYQDVLTTVEPTTATGRTYCISKKETSAAVAALKRKLKA
uniref:uncharacterized protein n=1 Tax=Myxine glutinosa TaxID=7769 RepID=UPI00358EEC48